MSSPVPSHKLQTDSCRQRVWPTLDEICAIRVLLRWAQILDICRVPAQEPRQASALRHLLHLKSRVITALRCLAWYSGTASHSSLMMKRAGATIAFVLILTASTQPADAFLFGILSRFFQPFPIVGIQTYATPTQIGTAYVNKFPFTTPPARKPCNGLSSMLPSCFDF